MWLIEIIFIVPLWFICFGIINQYLGYNDDFNFQKKQEIRRKRTAQPNQRQKMIEKIRDVQTREQQRLISNIQNPSGDLTLSNERNMSNIITPDCN